MTLRTLALFLGFLLAASSSFAASGKTGTPITPELANAYFESCMAKHDPRLTAENQMAFCSCTSVKMMETMSVEDVRLMTENSPRGHGTVNYMLLYVYGPCMSYPVYDLTYGACIHDGKIDMLGLKTSREDLCGCIAEKTGNWLGEAGIDIMSDVLINNPDTENPLSPVLESHEFQKKAYESLVICLAG